MAKKQAKAKVRARPKRAAGDPGVAPLVFRPSSSVRALVEEHAAKAGHTLSSEIDEGLRRTYWREDAYVEAQERMFGSSHGYALAFMTARIIAGIEHEMQASVKNSEPARTQAEAACAFVIQAVLAGWRNGGGPVLVQTPALPPRLRGDELELDDDQDREQPWHRVVKAIHRNLTGETDDLWWPLSDRQTGEKRRHRAEPPLRPSIDVLREVWPAAAIAA